MEHRRPVCITKDPHLRLSPSHTSPFSSAQHHHPGLRGTSRIAFHSAHLYLYTPILLSRRTFPSKTVCTSSPRDHIASAPSTVCTSLHPTVDTHIPVYSPAFGSVRHCYPSPLTFSHPAVSLAYNLCCLSRQHGLAYQQWQPSLPPSTQDFGTVDQTQLPISPTWPWPI
jgi:hypothetical protein